jgi:hypothetical protein
MPVMQRGCALAPAEEIEVPNADEWRRHARGHGAFFLDFNLDALGYNSLSFGVLLRVMAKGRNINTKRNRSVVSVKPTRACGNKLRAAAADGETVDCKTAAATDPLVWWKLLKVAVYLCTL